MSSYPSLHGQLGWNKRTKQPQYILTWDINDEQPILTGDVQFAFVNGGAEESGTVDVRTGTTSIKNGGSRPFDFKTSLITVTTPKNVELKADGVDVVGGDTLCIAVAKGYSGPEPNPGRQILATYFLTALRLPNGISDGNGHGVNVPEVTTIGTKSSPSKLKIQYGYEEQISNLHICGWNPDAGTNGEWVPYEEMRGNINEVEISFTDLGLYALMTDDRFKVPPVSYLNAQEQAFKELSESALESMKALQSAAKSAEAAVRMANTLNGGNGQNGSYIG
ncbi:MAG: hypothetical protein AAF702_11435 [Chloroflexota bacterium]